MNPFQKKLCLGLVLMALLSPLGLFLPEKFKAGGAWGEWGVETLRQALGYVPAGLQKYATLWQAPIPDYILGGEGASMGYQVISYIASGLLGILVVGLAAYAISRSLVKREN